MKRRRTVRFGGQVDADGFRFELSGGDLALDFTNTVDERGAAAPRERLGGYGDLVSWARQADILDDTTADQLVRGAERHRSRAARIFRDALMLRETIYAIFGEGDTSATRLAALEDFHAKAMAHRHLVSEGASIRWAWRGDGLDRILWPVALAATALLTSDRRARVSVCEGDPCRWLFIDNSRRGNRRWCDMSVCGNRAKARRHHAKTRETRDQP